jgi:hypothetical protein
MKDPSQYTQFLPRFNDIVEPRQLYVQMLNRYKRTEVQAANDDPVQHLYLLAGQESWYTRTRG